MSAAAEPGVVGIPSGRYFGFVIGGALPAALAADWLTSTWDQNAGLVVGGPSAAVVEEVTGEWLKDLLGIPTTASFSFVTGCQMAHVTCLAAARHAVLERVGWDVESDGLAGSPPIAVVTGGKRHVTIDRALRLLGLGNGCDGPCRRRRGGSHAGCDALDEALRGGERSDDRLRPGGRGEHRRLRPARARSPRSARTREHGCTSTARSGSGPLRPPSSLT